MFPSLLATATIGALLAEAKVPDSYPVIDCWDWASMQDDFFTVPNFTIDRTANIMSFILASRYIPMHRHENARRGRDLP